MKEGFPSLICSSCIDRLRIAYDFRLVCLQSDQTLCKYLEHISINSKQTKNFVEGTLSLPTTKFGFGTSTSEFVYNERQQNVEYVQLKHFLDSDNDINRSENVVSTRCTSPDSTCKGRYLM